MVSNICNAENKDTCRYHGTKASSTVDANNPVSVKSKACSVCKQNKNSTEFSKNAARSDGLQTICKPCRKEYNKKYYKDTPEKNVLRTKHILRKQLLIEAVTVPLKEKGCTDCGEYYKSSMEFDHVSGTKEIEIGSLKKMSFSDKEMLEVLSDELAKCEVCCANCHRLRTISRQKNNLRREYLETGKSKGLSESGKWLYDSLAKVKCVDCGNSNSLIMELDHVRGEKVNQLSRMVRKSSAYTLEQVKEEYAKCDPRCPNCHKKVTNDRAVGLKESKQEVKPRKQNSKVCSCGREKTLGAKTCLECQYAKQRKTTYPEASQLVDMIKLSSWENVARQLGVSSNSIRKHLRRKGVDTSVIKSP